MFLYSIHVLQYTSHTLVSFSFPTLRSSDLHALLLWRAGRGQPLAESPGQGGDATVSPIRHGTLVYARAQPPACGSVKRLRSEEHTSELQSLRHLVCRLLLERQNNIRR